MKYTLKNLGELYALKNNYRLSIDNYERMLTLLNNKKDKDLRGEVMTSLGKSYLAINDLKKAAEYLRAGLAFNRIQGNDLGVLISLNAFADLNIKNNRLRLAKTQLDEANKLGKKLNNEEELLYNYKLNTELSSVRNFHQDAFYWQKQYFYLKEKLNKEKLEALTLQIKSNQASNISTNLVSLKEKNKNIPEKKGSKLSSSQKQNTLLIYGLIASLVFVTALLIFSYLKSSKNTTTTKELSKKNESLGQKNKSLVQKNIQLEEVNQVKDKLFSIVSHDLKDSVSSIKAFLDLLKDDGITKEEFNNLIPELSENANNASSLLFNLLNWSKSQMQNLQSKPELFNIQEVFQIKISLIEKKVNDKGIIVIDESRREFVYADKSMMEIVIQNLITNAVKFTGKGDVITVSNQDYNGKILICIEDTGIGISE